MNRCQGLAVLVLAVAITCIGLPNVQADYSLSSSVSGDGGYDFQSMLIQLSKNTGATGAYIDFDYAITVAADSSNWGEGYVNLYANHNPIATPGFTSQGSTSASWPSLGSYSFFVPLSDFSLNSGVYSLEIDLETISAGSGSASANVNATAVPIPPTVLLFGSGLTGIVLLRKRFWGGMKI